MELNVIVAYDKNRVIGFEGDMPWGRLPVDLKRFKELTSGHTVIMGRVTYESIGRALPERRNIVITSQASLEIDGCETASSFEAALELAAAEEEVFVIGGSSLYSLALDAAGKLYVTEINAAFEGDRYFPETGPEWIEVSRETHLPDEQNKYGVTFLVYERAS